MGKWSKAYWLDLGERVGSTLVYQLITLLGMDLADVDMGVLWPLVAVPTLLALLKGLLANMSNPKSGASLVPSPPPGPVLRDEAGHAPPDA